MTDHNLDVPLLMEELASRLSRRPLSEAWGDQITDYDPLIGEPDYHHRPGSRRSGAEDRKDGDFWPHFRDESKLAIIRGAAEAMGVIDTTAIGAMETLTSYIIGTGLQYSVEPREGVPESEDLIRGIQYLIDEFEERVEWNGDLDAETFQRFRREGEAFLRVVIDEEGVPTLDVIEPSWVSEPHETSRIEDWLGLPELNWKYGIATDPKFPSRVIGYSVFRHGDLNDWEFVPESEMYHVKANVPRNVKRGLTDFYAGEQWVDSVGKIITNTLEGAAIQASIAYIREYGAATRNADINSAADALVEFNSTLRGLDGNTRTIPTERHYPGKVLDIRGAKFLAGPGSANIGGYVQAIQAGYRKLAQRWQMPEFMISGDASNANYASTLVAESPFVKSAGRIQFQVERSHSKLLWKIVDAYHKSGRISYSAEEARRLVKIKATGPDVEAHDRTQEHTIRMDEVREGVRSLKSWSEEIGLDYEVEQEQIKKENPLGASLTPSDASALGAATMGSSPAEVRQAVREASEGVSL